MNVLKTSKSQNKLGWKYPTLLLAMAILMLLAPMTQVVFGQVSPIDLPGTIGLGNSGCSFYSVVLYAVIGIIIGIIVGYFLGTRKH